MALLQNFIFLATGIFSGAAIYISLVEHPARMSISASLARKQFAPSYRRATVMQAGLAVFIVVASLLLWASGGAMLYLINAISFVGIIIMTLVVMMPVNKRLCNDISLAEQEIMQLLGFWGRWHSVRSAVSLMMFCMLVFV